MLQKTLMVACLCLFVVTSMVFINSSKVYAASDANCQQTSNRILGFPTWYKYLNPRFEDGECKLDAKFPESVGKILLAVFEILLRVAGVLAIIFTIWGGFQFILSQGEPERANQARSTLINALIGLAITISAVAIVNLVGRNL